MKRDVREGEPVVIMMMDTPNAEIMRTWANFCNAFPQRSPQEHFGVAMSRYMSEMGIDLDEIAPPGALDPLIRPDL